MRPSSSYRLAWPPPPLPAQGRRCRRAIVFPLVGGLVGSEEETREQMARGGSLIRYDYHADRRTDSA